MNDEPICNCPLCGRTHRKMPFGTPPSAISDTVTIPRPQYEAFKRSAKVLATLSANGHTGVGYGIIDEALAALRAATIEIEG